MENPDLPDAQQEQSADGSREQVRCSEFAAVLRSFTWRTGIFSQLNSRFCLKGGKKPFFEKQVSVGHYVNLSKQSARWRGSKRRYE